MAQMKMFFKFIVLIAVISSAIAEDTKDNKHIRNVAETPIVLRQVETFDVVTEDSEDEELLTSLDDNAGWTSCNMTTDPLLSCYDCHNRVVCLPQGGRIRPCAPFKPFCYYGFCTHFPTAECSTIPTTTESEKL
ncbi:hypothetical protein K1T71_009781 [Dendrolimus kikuchii]|uniref:Uncharacterized protein n=1 Tax=Dendrolimus kikuchii TaxID=765133 RepID=A0ACC1CSZ2_9NEOP|nr:hypothetical protein K1T71_009781 [Dendrolimus kikuchii]